MALKKFGQYKLVGMSNNIMKAAKRLKHLISEYECKVLIIAWRSANPSHPPFPFMSKKKNLDFLPAIDKRPNQLSSTNQLDPS